MLADSQLIPPHGGVLKTCRQSTSTVSTPKTKLTLDSVALADLQMLTVGAYSPLVGFMNAATRQSVALDMRLPNGLVWPIPITLPVPEGSVKEIKHGDVVALQNAQETVAYLTVEEVYKRDGAEEARHVFGTDDVAHPGVAQLLERGPWCIAGPVSSLTDHVMKPFADVPSHSPAASRAAFVERKWQRIVGFQTRNPVHRAHEYIIKCAMESCDGLFLHPLVGATKNDDIPAEVRLKCYRALVQAALPNDRVILSTLPAPMRYAGPREAILHALVRQNYGCSHFIVGRDHAGVGNFYGTYDAQKIFGQFGRGEIVIEPLFFENSFFCRRCAQMASSKTCPHESQEHIFLSGTKVREMLRRGERPPHEFSRPEVVDVLLKWAAA